MKRYIAIALCVAGSLATAAKPVLAQQNFVQFDLVPNQKFVGCLGVEGGPTPTAKVTVIRGKLNDTLFLQARHLRPNLAFDMFTVQKSPFLATGAADPAFVPNDFGMAWYQSDLQADSRGRADVEIKTILLDQIFGFDQDVNLPPTNTFHVGFWFNNPKDAAGCHFDVTKPTPFNGEHKAGPLAMISLPVGDTNLGPLCTNPNSDGTCNP
jgi:hypothetical protein